MFSIADWIKNSSKRWDFIENKSKSNVSIYSYIRLYLLVRAGGRIFSFLLFHYNICVQWYTGCGLGKSYEKKVVRQNGIQRGWTFRFLVSYDYFINVPPVPLSPLVKIIECESLYSSGTKWPMFTLTYILYDQILLYQIF